MTLIKINEPGGAAAPRARRHAAGIDLGTTNSLVATVKDGRPCVLTDESGRHRLPSVVYYSAEGAPIVGYDALGKIADDPANTIASVKRYMGRHPDEVPALKKAKGGGAIHRFIYGDDGVARFDTVAGEKTAVEVSADILADLKRRAGRDPACDTIDGVVITVPAYFDDTQRQATRDAAQLAGLKVMRLLNEPTAAAIAYGIDAENTDGETIAVYDLGGGTFDISVLRLERGVFRILATGGRSALGGDDFDLLVTERLMDDGDCRESDPGVLRMLMREAIRMKIELSEHDSVTRRITLPNGHTWKQTLTRNDLEELIAPLVDKTIVSCADTLHDAGVEVEHVNKVILVGGATRTPLVRRRVIEFFGMPPLKDIDPDKVVALGAALQADILAGNRPDNDMLLLDVIPLSLGIETMGGLVEHIIRRNTTIPCAETREYTTHKDGQTGMSIHVMQGERDLVDDCRSLARFELKGIPPLAAGAARVSVRFQVDADGLLEVEAREIETGNKASIEIKPSYGLSGEQIEKMLRESARFSEEDVAARKLRETKVDAQRVLDALDSALAADRDLLDDDEYVAIMEVREKLNNALDGATADEIVRAIKAVERAGEGFVERRMNRDITRAIGGRAVDDISRGV